MAKGQVLIVIAFASLIYCSELENTEQKKRGVEKVTALNSIPTGTQKQEYSYSVYSQNSQSPSTQSYQNQVSGSFYPRQGSSQYSSFNPSTDASSTYSSQQHVSPQSTSQFVPINFVPNPSYQAKYQAGPSKSPNVHLAIVQPNSYPSQSILPYNHLAHSLFSPNQMHQINSQQGSPHQISQFSPHANYQPLQLENPYLSQPSAMVLLAQPNPSIYSNVLYSNPIQGFNYYPSNFQNKYPSSTHQSEYEKYQGPITQNIPKEENEVGTRNSDYPSSLDSSSGYKNAYSGRTSYGKLQS